MPTIKITRPFQWSPDGKQVIDYSKGVEDVPERCAVVAVEQMEVATLLGDKEKSDLEAEAKAQAEAEQKAQADAEAKAAENADSSKEQPPAKAAKTTTKK